MELRRRRTKFIQKDEHNNLFCYKCEQYLPVEGFDTNQEGWYREFKDRRCKKCKCEQRRRRNRLDHNRISIDRILVSRWNGTKCRANKKGYNINFDWTFLKELWELQKGNCAISKIPMTYEMFNGRTPTNVSVDRIDSNKGYEKGNIQLVCMAVNQMKSDLDAEEFIYFCEQIVNNNEYKYKEK
jgi:hypothetical protein